MRYEDIDAVRWSQLKAMRTSPLEYRYRLLEAEQEEKKHLRLGTAVHVLLLQPELWDARYAVCPATTAKSRNSKAYTEFASTCGNKTVLLEAEYDAASAMASAVRFDPMAHPYVCSGAAEHVITWTDDETGLACKAQVDTLDGRIIEVKSTHDHKPGPRGFGKLVHDFGYHGQIAHYLAGAEANGIDVSDPPVIVTVQSEPPHDVVVYHVPEDVVDVGERLRRRLLRRLARCRETGEWPGVAGGRELMLEIPAYSYDEVNATDDDEEAA